MGRVARGLCCWIFKRRTFFSTCLLVALLLTGLHLYREDDYAEFNTDVFEQFEGAEKETIPEIHDEKGIPDKMYPLAPAPDNKTHVSHRHELVRERCQTSQLTPQRNKPWLPKFTWSPIISTAHVPNIFYCPLAKAGSTFFTRYIIAMEKPGVMTSPFDVKIEDAKRSRLKSYSSLLPIKRKREILEHSFKFVFSRNPYFRIFSAYIDKLYSPNPYYWKEWGVKAATHAHLSRSKLNACGNGVSFPDFVKIVIAFLHKKDMHFVPMVDICRVCEVDWDMIGWVEESVRDIDFLSSKIGVNSSFQHHEGYRMASAMDVIHDSTADSIQHWIGDIKQCMSLNNMGRIIWRRLQIRGIIYHDISFPFSDDEMESITLERFQLQCKKAAEKSVDRSKLKKQKEDAFREAYGLVDKQDLERLQEIYKHDFFIFGYDPQPSSIFGNVGKSTKEKILDWTRDWV